MSDALKYELFNANILIDRDVDIFIVFIRKENS